MPIYEFGSFQLDLTERCLLRNGQFLSLAQKPFEILALLVENQGHLITKEELMNKLWPNTSVEDGNLTVSMSKIRRVLGEDKRRHKFIATYPRRGYRFIAEVRSVGEGRIDSIAVLPFDHADTIQDVEYLTDGLTESLIYCLSKLPNLRVAPSSSVFPYKGKRTESRKIANKLGVRSVLTGRITLRGENLTISTELLDARCNALLWGERYHRKISDLLTTQHDIALEITEKLKLRLSAEVRERITERLTKSNEAYQLYLRGRFHWNKRSEEEINKSIEYFKKAIKIDSGYTPSYVGLANSYNVLGYYSILAPKVAFPRARAAALRALALDDSLAEAHASLGYARLYYDWDWNGAEQSFKRSIHLDPNCPTTHQFYANYLGVMGRFEEAIAEFKRALDIDSVSLIANASLGCCYYFARQYDRAIEQCRFTIEMDRHFELAHVWLGWAYLQKGMWEEAILEYEKAVDLSFGRAGIIAALGTAYALSGKRRRAQKVLEDLRKLAAQRYVSPHRVACIHAALSEIDKAFECLDQAYDDRSHLLVGLNIDPRLDALRADPRFDTLARRVGLAPHDLRSSQG